MSGIAQGFVRDLVKRLQKQNLCLDSRLWTFSMDTHAMGKLTGREGHNTEFRAGSSEKDTHTVSGPCPCAQANWQPTHASFFKGGLQVFCNYVYLSHKAACAKQHFFHPCLDENF